MRISQQNHRLVPVIMTVFDCFVFPLNQDMHAPLSLSRQGTRGSHAPRKSLRLPPTPTFGCLPSFVFFLVTKTKKKTEKLA